jgi:predicted secreted Zn-dependent protease
LLGGTAFGGWPAAADIKASSVIRYYTVPGTTAEGLRRSIASSPLDHQSSGAIGRTDATFDFSVTVSNRGATCEPAGVLIAVKFVTTLPKATEAAMTAATRVQWRELVAFTRRHEATHKAIYLRCLEDFTRIARVLKSRSGCDALVAQAGRQFDASMKVCGRRHDAFDAAESQRLEQLSIFRSAR